MSQKLPIALISFAIYSQTNNPSFVCIHKLGNKIDEYMQHHTSASF